MKRTITDPHKVNHKMYVILMALSFLTLWGSILIPTDCCRLLSSCAEVIKNLSYGCIASTGVAWIIDCNNTKSANKKANAIYDSMYFELKFQISSYISLWAELCDISFKDRDYSSEKNTWDGWYRTVKSNFEKATPERQDHLLSFFRKQLVEEVKAVNKAIEKLQSQRPLLTLNDAMNSDMDRILSDFQFEFHALDLDLSREDTPEYFWLHMEATTSDLMRYIDNWADIRYYNFLIFSPRQFFQKTPELIAAVLLSEDPQKEKSTHVK